MNHFRDKVAIVTGGATGIGRALCEELGRRQAKMVIAVDINGEGAQEVASGITTAGGKARGVYLDVTQAVKVQELVNDTVTQHGQLDYMFNNAGVGVGGEFRHLNPEHWQHVMDVNLRGVIYGTEAAYRVMVSQHSGHIINISSLAGLLPLPLGTPYATSKHAVMGFSTSLRIEAAKLGVKVSVVCPAFIKTGIYDRTPFIGLQREGAVSQLASMRIMSPERCARIILRDVERNLAIIIVPKRARLLWWLHRANPAIISYFLGRRLGTK
ncbi:MAG: SDR family NAD(P)-dependent oxidoreductase [Chloroflexi bacterium]|nr:SDR family NAD(P)-dependent oxidoreductase [Chloroflexota bacterium]